MTAFAALALGGCGTQRPEPVPTVRCCHRRPAGWSHLRTSGPSRPRPGRKRSGMLATGREQPPWTSHSPGTRGSGGSHPGQGQDDPSEPPRPRRRAHSRPEGAGCDLRPRCTRPRRRPGGCAGSLMLFGALGIGLRTGDAVWPPTAPLPSRAKGVGRSAHESPCDRTGPLTRQPRTSRRSTKG